MLKKKYQQLVQDDRLTYDAAQDFVIAYLDNVFADLVNAHQERASLVNKLLAWLKLKQFRVVPGLYLWGAVGRGKTLLMDLFYEHLPLDKKLRLHFHHFMYRVHQELGSLAGQKDPLKLIARRFKQEADVICFDEFFVADIADAMLLGKLLEYLFANNITLIATSNVIPHELYKNGLQRAQFLPAIGLLEDNLEVVKIESKIDYRLRSLTHINLYHFPADAKAWQALNKDFVDLAPEAELALDYQEGVENNAVEINSRMIPTVKLVDDIIWCDFKALCALPRSVADYIELARCYHTIILSDIPVLTEQLEDQARRFIALIDELYERKVKLIISAAVPMTDLYRGQQLKFEFKRTFSRLTEMQSAEYLAQAHIPI